MRIVFSDSDRRLSDIVRSVLEPDGHEIVVAPSLELAERRCRSEEVDLLICDVSGDRLGELHRFDGVGLGDGIAVLLASSTHQPDDGLLRASMSEVGASGFLRKPFSVLDLGDHVRRIAGTIGRPATPSLRTSTRGTSTRAPATGMFGGQGGAEVEITIDDPDDGDLDDWGTALDQSRWQGGAPPSNTTGPVDRRSAAKLARLWASRATGTLHLEGGRRVDSRRARLVDGGPATPEDLRFLIEALYRDGLAFVEGAQRGQGDWEGLGQVLFQRIRNPESIRYVEVNRYQSVATTSLAGACSALPLSAEVRRIVRAVDGQTPLGQLVASLGLRPESVAPDVECLVRLRLLTLHHPDSAPRRARRLRKGRDASRSSHRHSLSQSFGSSDTSTTHPGPGGRRGARDASGGGWGASNRDLDDPSSGHTSLAGRGKGRGRERLRRAMRGAPTAGSAAQIEKRLERELGVLGGAHYSAVLGIPRGSGSRLIEQAAKRQVVRYQELAHASHISERARDLAARILVIVENARKAALGQVQSDAPGVPEDLEVTDAADHAPPATEEDRLLEQGRRLIADLKWDAADRVLSRAKHLRLDHSGVLAHLGWARFHNERFAEAERTEEARDLLLLAEQFDGQNADAALFLAVVLESEGKVDAALRRAKRARKLAPGNARAKAVYDRLARAAKSED